MADIGFGSDEGDRHAVANLAPAQVGDEDEREFIGRAEAGGALHGADHDRAGVLAEGLPAMRTPSRHGRRGRSSWCWLAGRGLRSRRRPAWGRWRSRDSRRRCAAPSPSSTVFLRRVDPRCARRRRKPMPSLRENLRQMDLDVLGFAPVDRDPGVRGHEMEPLRLRDDHDRRPRAQQLAQLEGHRHAAEARRR